MTKRPVRTLSRLRIAGAGMWLATLAGCARCGEGCSEDAVAVVSAVESNVERDHVHAVESWQAAGVRDPIRIGEAVRTGPNGRAELELSAGGGLRLGPASMVRFGGRPNEAPSLAWERGTIDIETDQAFVITTEFGPLRVQRGTHLTAAYGDQGVRIEVVVGLAEFADGTRIQEGEAFDGRTAPDDSAAGGTEVQDDASADELVAAEAVPESGAPSAADPQAAESGPRLPGIRGYEFSVAGGAGGVIHHPAPPALVGINTGCSDGEVRVVSGGSSTTYTGGGTIGVRMGRGEARYEVFCARQATTRGRFVVTVDAGRRRLNTQSQPHAVVADGRRYTFLYEGALPTLLLRWHAAPDAERYTVHLTGTRRITELTSPTPTVRIPTSALRDGEMTFRFAASGQESPRTTITLRYDTATPTAMVDSPPDRGFAGGATVTISGTAQLGSQVAVGGQPLEVDGRGSFSGTTNAEGGGLAVRITTPSHGTHYFVRRGAGR